MESRTNDSTDAPWSVAGGVGARGKGNGFGVQGSGFRKENEGFEISDFRFQKGTEGGLCQRIRRHSPPGGFRIGFDGERMVGAGVACVVQPESMGRMGSCIARR